jgi:hypothetical protein
VSGIFWEFELEREGKSKIWEGNKTRTLIFVGLKLKFTVFLFYFGILWELPVERDSLDSCQH